MKSEFSIRASEQRDLAAISAIYAHHVLHGLASFEIDPPDAAEMARRREQVLAQGLPHLVAELDGRVAGYAYAALFRARPAYRFTVEDSIYVEAGAVGRGAGRLLLERLVAECTRAGYRQMIAVIGDSDNAASIGLHAACGFKPAGSLRYVGYKFGRWVDSVMMQRELGVGHRSAPGNGGPL